jgi:hypothetical protein
LFLKIREWFEVGVVFISFPMTKPFLPRSGFSAFLQTLSGGPVLGANATAP